MADEGNVTRVDNPMHKRPNVTTRKRHKKPSVEEATRVRLMLHPSYIPEGGAPKDRRLYPACISMGRFCFKSCAGCDPFCEGRVSMFANLGSGPSSYFKNLKLLIWAFALMTAFSIPALVINSFNRGTAATTSLSIADTTLAGLSPSAGTDGSGAVTSHVRLPTLDGGFRLVSRETVAIIYSLCDLGGALVFALAFLWARSFTRREEKQVSKNTVTASDYTIFLPWIPRDTVEDDLITHFTNVTTTEMSPDGLKIAEVHVVEDNTAMVGLFVERGRVFRQIERLQERIGRLEEQVRMGVLGCTACCGGLPGTVSRLKRFRELLAQRAEVLSHKATLRASKGAVAAFVTFEEATAAEFVLSVYPDTFASWCCQSKARRLGGKTRLQVQPAPPPASVLWSNLAVGACEQRLRQTLTGMLTAIFLVGSFVLLWFASWQHDRYLQSQSAATCTEASMVERLDAGLINATSVSALPREHPDSYCYCGSLSWSTFAPSAIEANTGGWSERCASFSCPAYFAQAPGGIASLPFCVTFIRDRAITIALTVAASLAVLLINGLLATIMRMLTLLEAHKSFEDLNASLQLRLFFAQFFNTALLMILVNVAWPGTTTLPEEFKTGKWSDLTAGWYGTVGAQIIVTMLINVVSTHLYPLATAFLYFRTIGQKNQDAPSQRDLNERFVGPYADWSLRYAQLANVMAVCFAFSTGMPLLMPVALVSFIVSYWVDKLLFLWFFRRPPSFGSSVQRSFVSLMPLALILHLAWGSWAISYGPLLDWTGIDPLRVRRYVSLASNIIDAAAPSVVAEGAGRLTKLQALPLFVFFLFMVAAMFLQLVLGGLSQLLKGFFNFITCGACAVRDLSLEKDDPTMQPNYSEACDPKNVGKPRGIVGLPSYNLLLNPEIMSAFAISPEWAASHKTLSEVALYKIGNAGMSMRQIPGAAGSIHAGLTAAAAGTGNGATPSALTAGQELALARAKAAQAHARRTGGEFGYGTSGYGMTDYDGLPIDSTRSSSLVSPGPGLRSTLAAGGSGAAGPQGGYTAVQVNPVLAAAGQKAATGVAQGSSEGYSGEVGPYRTSDGSVWTATRGSYDEGQEEDGEGEYYEDEEEEDDAWDDNEVGGYMAGHAPAYTASSRRLNIAPNAARMPPPPPPPPGGFHNAFAAARGGAGKPVLAPPQEVQSRRRISRALQEPSDGLSLVQQAASDMEAAVARRLGVQQNAVGPNGEVTSSEAQIATAAAAALIMLRNQLAMVPPGSTRSRELSAAIAHLSTFVTLEAEVLTPTGWGQASSVDGGGGPWARGAGGAGGAQLPAAPYGGSLSPASLARGKSSRWVLRTAVAAGSPGSAPASASGSHRGSNAGGVDMDSSEAGFSHAAALSDLTRLDTALELGHAPDSSSVSVSMPQPVFIPSAPEALQDSARPVFSSASANTPTGELLHGGMVAGASEYYAQDREATAVPMAAVLPVAPVVAVMAAPPPPPPPVPMPMPVPVPMAVVTEAVPPPPPFAEAMVMAEAPAAPPVPANEAAIMTEVVPMELPADSEVHGVEVRSVPNGTGV